MMSRSCTILSACALALAAGSFPMAAHAQSADAMLCDRVAADPADPDKPADVRGVREIEPSDVVTAVKFCQVAAKSSRRAMYQLGRGYAANRQMPEAIAAWRKAADKGSTSAMVELGVLYATGSGGLTKDPAQARAMFERAAAAGNPRGVANLAALSHVGGGAPSDPVKTRAVLTRAADANAEAQYQLGLMLADGVGGPKDDVGARALFDKAAAQGHAGALLQMGAFAQSGRGGPKDSSAAKGYFERAAAAGSEEAKAALKKSECSWVVKDKRGNVVTHLCF
jgi:uncharacterized protein